MPAATDDELMENNTHTAPIVCPETVPKSSMAWGVSLENAKLISGVFRHAIRRPGRNHDHFDVHGAHAFQGG